MSQNLSDDRPPVEMQGPAETPNAFRLRPGYPRVTRLSRKVLLAGSAMGLTVVAGAAFWALQKNKTTGPSPEELYSTDHHSIADSIAALPRDYAAAQRQVPQLGPPLPGDLGRPILSAQGQSPTVFGTTLDQDQQRQNQENEAARVSRLFVSTSVRGSQNPTTNESTGDRVIPSTSPSNNEDGLTLNAQDRKLAFANAVVDRRTTNADRITKAASAFVVQAGTVVPGALITGIRSDLPGQIVAQVTENVYDSPTGRFLLVPQGARLIGLYDSQIAFGQSRVLLVWTRLIMPNGRSIVLERQPGADAAGYAGLEDEVDNHWGELVKAAALSTSLAIGTELGEGSDANSNNGAIVQALRHGAADSLSQTGQQVVRRGLNIQPTLTIRPGFPVRVIVHRDLVLEPYRG
ncbi:TrbI/VirB10 family protein [Bradyrhizobium sp. ORS 86]|uniref:TrbI/VirB10 family protein n=2 Tax=Bradyrhizobium TaxID=374 RepID=UPI00389109E6